MKRGTSLAAALLMVSTAHSFDIQAHRGGRGLVPENTLPAFAHALALGVTTLELDCAITRDGVVVVSHDLLLNPDITRDAKGAWLPRAGPPIARLDYEALQRYDVGRIRPGTRYAARFPAQQAIDGTRVPRLVEVFDLARRAGNDTVRFNIETKVSPLEPNHTEPPESFARKVIKAVRASGMQQRVAIQSFDWRTLKVVQQEAPEIPTVHLTAQQDFMDNIRAGEGRSPWTVGLHVSQFGGSIPRMIKSAGGAVWSPYYVEVTREAVREAQLLGLRVVVWTVNNEADMRRMIALGVDGIISDYPDRLRNVAAQAGIPLPAATPVR
ncbi:MAG: glycerophosphodiester phosphodiesterase [Betaproteobacteria bacterium]